MTLHLILTVHGCLLQAFLGLQKRRDGCRVAREIDSDDHTGLHAPDSTAGARA